MLTMKEHLENLQEPYRSEALKAIADRPRSAQMEFSDQREALAWALPPGALKKDPFWAGALASKRKRIQGKTYVKAYNVWHPEPGEDIEASTDGSLWAKCTFVSRNPANTGGKYVVINQRGQPQFCQLIRPLRQSPFNRRA